MKDQRSKIDPHPRFESNQPTLIEGEDFYREGPNIVFTAAYLLRRGYCCESGCRHCPYGFRKDGRSDVPREEETED